MSGLCEPGNRWLFRSGVPGVQPVTWWGDGEMHDEGKALCVAHSIAHGSGFREVTANVPVQPVIDALLDDPDTAEAVLAAVVSRLGRVLATA